MSGNNSRILPCSARNEFTQTNDIFFIKEIESNEDKSNFMYKIFEFGIQLHDAPFQHADPFIRKDFMHDSSEQEHKFGFAYNRFDLLSKAWILFVEDFVFNFENYEFDEFQNVVPPEETERFLDVFYTFPFFACSVLVFEKIEEVWVENVL